MRSKRASRGRAWRRARGPPKWSSRCTTQVRWAETSRPCARWPRYTAEGSWYYEIIAPGFKYNMTDVAGACGVHQLRRADDLWRRRAAVAARLTAGLAGLDGAAVDLPKELPDRRHAWHLYSIK